MTKIRSIKELNIYEKNKILFIFLNRPEKHNALSLEMIQELTSLFRKVDRREEEFKSLPLRGLLLSGRGKSFCSGGDLGWLQSAVKLDFKKNLQEAYDLFLLFSTASQCRVPMVAWLKGNVMGGGLCLASICDFVLAEEGTCFSFSEIKRGLVPSVISPFILQKVPLALAQPLMLTGESFDVSKALSCHLIQDFGSREEVIKKMENVFVSLFQNGPTALEQTKKLLRGIQGKPPEEVKRTVCEMISRRRLSEEAQEGLTSFLQKRVPSWSEKFSSFSKDELKN